MSCFTCLQFPITNGSTAHSLCRSSAADVPMSHGLLNISPMRNSLSLLRCKKRKLESLHASLLPGGLSCCDEGLCLAGDYICYTCVKVRAQMEVEVDCGATLIVSPSSILEQWRNEIAKHTHAGTPLAAP